MKNQKLVVGALLLALLAGGGWYWWSNRQGNAPAYRTAKVERGPITATVSSTGTLNPVTSVQVGTQVSGQIQQLFVDFNSPVKKGELIARIDPETFTYRVRQAEADLESARSSVGRAQVAQVIANRDLARAKELVARNFVSPAELDRAQSTFDLAAAEVRTAQAVVQQRAAQVATARVDLSRTEIRAPVDGVVIKRSVDVGQTVAASLQAPELFVIAKDLRDMQVDTSIDEADVGRIKIGLRATFTVDAFPGRQFVGEVRSVRKAAQSVQNVVTYIAIISANNERGELLPGMTANVRIVTDSRDSVLKVPNAALRFRPAGESAAAKGDGAKEGQGKATQGADAGASKGAGTSGGGGGQLNQFRERIVAELKMDAEQQQRLDPIFAEMRNKFMGVRDLPEEARARQSAAIRSDMRARVEEILKPEQKARYAELVTELAGRAGGGQTTRGRIYLMDANKPKAIEVRVGLSDGAMSEVAGDGLVEGAEVIIGLQSAASSPPAQKAGAPKMMF
ncbi:MAG TPA: efflux RND transporter periplasmic adaptor subunit [Burkholderiaceae bacterium]|nr:efflux RND transporter periplasmic adaptor subunit [Burkholderiaceae bacterium]